MQSPRTTTTILTTISTVLTTLVTLAHGSRLPPSTCVDQYRKDVERCLASGGPGERCQDDGADRYRRCLRERGDRALPAINDRRDTIDLEEFPPLPDGTAAAELSLSDPLATDTTVELTVHVNTQTGAHAFTELSFGVATLEAETLEVVDVEIGSGLVEYVLANGEPPECDIVIYPNRQASVGSITKLFDGIAYNSDLYGTEFLRITYQVLRPDVAEATLQIYDAEDVRWFSAKRFRVLPNSKDSAQVLLRDRSFIRGDADGDLRLNVSDAVAIAGYLFFDQSLDCLDAADADDNAVVDLSDVLEVLNTVTGSRSEVSAVCAQDATTDSLDCASHACSL